MTRLFWQSARLSDMHQIVANDKRTDSTTGVPRGLQPFFLSHNPFLS